MSETTTAAPALQPAAASEPAAVPAAVVAAPEVAASASVTPAPAEAAGSETPAALTPHTDTPSLLEEPPAPVESKPAEAPPAEPAAEATKYEFKFPDAFKAEPEQLERVSALLGKSKVAPEDAQALIDLHTEVVSKLADSTLAHQHKAFSDLRTTWRGQIQSDAELGGSGFETTKRTVAQMRDEFVAPQHKQAFNDMLRTTGVGDHPEFWRFLNNVGRAFREPAPPPPGAKPAPAGKAPRSARASFYDHPASQALKS